MSKTLRELIESLADNQTPPRKRDVEQIRHYFPQLVEMLAGMDAVTESAQLISDSQQTDLVRVTMPKAAWDALQNTRKLAKKRIT